MRYFLISCSFLIVGCASYPTKNNFKSIDESSVKILNSYFSDAAKDYVYKAKISIKGNYFSGIFIVKKITNNEHRVVFTTEMGTKFFDFSYINNDFKVNYILKELDKKILINLLKNDFKVLIQTSPRQLNQFATDDYNIIQSEIYKNNLYYYLINKKLKKIVWVKNRNEKVRFVFSGINNNIVKNIQILHSNINLEIHLAAI